ncbi:isoprenoid synthase domain-containing protein [Flagelloscypha sp. PMI_526]|nr:isoprenoid synthase domain-containing protein [Flagelloscypha sp. PMI_526]
MVQFVLPDLVTACERFERQTNPHHALAGAESRAWLESYQMFSDNKKVFIASGQNELLVSHCYPFADYENFRTICDFVNLLFVVDEISDDQNGEDARATGEVFLKAMQNEGWHDGSSLASMTKDYRTRLLRRIGPNSARRFMKMCEDYINAVSREAKLRESGEILDLKPYIHLRRENSAVRLCFGLYEMCLGLDLPHYVFEDPSFMTVYFAACDHVCWANDVYSYAMEIEKGHTGNNVVSVLRRTKALDLQQASDFVGIYCDGLVNTFCKTRKSISSFDPAVERDVQLYIDALSCWMRGNLDWSFESQRYFGPDVKRIRQDRLVHVHTFVDSDEFEDSD